MRRPFAFRLISKSQQHLIHRLGHRRKVGIAQHAAQVDRDHRSNRSDRQVVWQCPERLFQLVAQGIKPEEYLGDGSLHSKLERSAKPFEGLCELLHAFLIGCRQAGHVATAGLALLQP